MLGKDDSTCRLCLFSDPDSMCMIRIFGIDSEFSPIADKIHFALHLKVAYDEAFPNYICSYCLQKCEFIITVKIWISKLLKKYTEVHSLLESYRAQSDDEEKEILRARCEEKSPRSPDRDWLSRLLNNRETIMNLSVLAHADKHLSDHVSETNLSVLTQTDEFSGEKDSVSSEYLGNKSLDTYFPRNDEHDSYGVKIHFTQNTEQDRAWAPFSEDGVSFEVAHVSKNSPKDLAGQVREENVSMDETNTSTAFPMIKSGSVEELTFVSLEYPFPSKVEDSASHAADCSSSNCTGQGRIWSVPCEQQTFVIESNSLVSKSGPIEHVSSGNASISGNDSSDGDGNDCNEINSSGLFLDMALQSSCEKKPLMCPECEEPFGRKKFLIKHLMSHGGAAEKYQCAVCKRKFISTLDLNRHLRAHNGLKPYECEKCGQYFSQRNLLEKHLNWHEGRKSHLCEICGQYLSSQQNLKMHMRYLHSSDIKKPFQCKECKRTFVRKHHLETHLVIHGKSRPYQCSICGITFKRSSQLREHELIHTGEKQYKCNECNKAFAHKRVLNIHKLLHSGMKRHQCSECNKSFVRRNGLITHLKTHM